MRISDKYVGFIKNAEHSWQTETRDFRFNNEFIVYYSHGDMELITINEWKEWERVGKQPVPGPSAA